jgi:hypothetical protein
VREREREREREDKKAIENICCSDIQKPNKGSCCRAGERDGEKPRSNGTVQMAMMI